MASGTSCSANRCRHRSRSSARAGSVMNVLPNMFVMTCSVIRPRTATPPGPNGRLASGYGRQRLLSPAPIVTGVCARVIRLIIVRAPKMDYP